MAVRLRAGRPGCQMCEGDVDRMPIASTLGTARVGSTWRLLGDVEDIDLDFDLED